MNQPPELTRILQRQQNQHQSEDQLENPHLTNVYQNCGFLVVVWHNYFDRIKDLSFTTAFSVSKNTIITATTNIFSTSLNRFANKFYYFPNIDYLTRYCTSKCTNRTSQQYDCFFNCLNKDQVIKANLKSTVQNISLLVLNEELQNDSFLKIGTIPFQSLVPDSSVKLVGYLNFRYLKDFKEFNEQRLNGRRAEINCKIVMLGDKTIEYIGVGLQGMAGCPILFQDDQGQFYAVGMNTNYNASIYTSQGIYFSEQVIGIIKKLQKSLLDPFELQPSISVHKEQLQQLQSKLIKGKQGQAQFDTSGNDEGGSNKSSCNSEMGDIFEMFEYFTIIEKRR